jgi:raffinose/stachyose/melibiose transport system substrate-binding protein
MTELKSKKDKRLNEDQLIEFLNKRLTRRKAITTTAKIGIAAAVGLVAGLAGGYYGGIATTPTQTVTTTVEKTVTVTSTATPTKVVTAPAKKIPLTIWHLWPEGSPTNEWLMWAVNKFNKENLRAEIKPVFVENEVFKRQIVTAMAAGNPPDIFHNWGGWMYLFRFVKEGMVVDLTPYMNKESPYIPGIPWKETILPGRMAQVTFTDGKIYGAPNMLLFESIFFNRKLFEEYDVTMPTNDWTWDEFKEIIKEIKQKVGGKEIYPIALGNAVAWTGMIYYMYFVLRLVGAPYVEQAMWNPDMRFDIEPFVEAGRLCQELVDLGAFNPGFNGLRDTDAAMLFANGKAFMEAIGTWIYAQAKTYNEENPEYFDVVAWPHFPNEKDSVNLVGGGDAWSVASTTKSADDAVQFIQLHVSPESQKKLMFDVRQIPGIKLEYLGLTEEEKKKIPTLVKHEMELASNANYITNYWDQGLPPVITKAVLENMVSLFGKTIKPEEVAKRLEDARQQWLKEADIK